MAILRTEPATFYPATYPFVDPLRVPGLSVQGGPLDPLGPMNTVYLIHDATFSGHEAFDFQNPYVWYSAQVLYGQNLSTDGYGLQPGQDVESNALAGIHALAVWS